MTITPAIYINVDVVQNNAKADKGGGITSIFFYGGDSVTSYDIDASCEYLQHFPEKLYDSTTFGTK